MAEIVNLRRARKRKARAADRREADANAARHGRDKGEVARDALEKAREARRHEGHRREETGPEASDASAPGSERDPGAE